MSRKAQVTMKVLTTQHLKGVKTKATKIVKEHTDLLQQEAKRRAPKRTGFLASRILKLRSFRKKKASIEDGIIVDCDYALFVHNGTRFQRAQPFLLEAFLFVRTRFESSLKDLGLRFRTRKNNI